MARNQTFPKGGLPRSTSPHCPSLIQLQGLGSALSLPSRVSGAPQMKLLEFRAGNSHKLNQKHLVVFMQRFLVQADVDVRRLQCPLQTTVVTIVWPSLLSAPARCHPQKLDGRPHTCGVNIFACVIFK